MIKTQVSPQDSKEWFTGKVWTFSCHLSSPIYKSLYTYNKLKVIRSCIRQLYMICQYSEVTWFFFVLFNMAKSLKYDDEIDYFWLYK